MTMILRSSSLHFLTMLVMSSALFSEEAVPWLLVLDDVRDNAGVLRQRKKKSPQGVDELMICGKRERWQSQERKWTTGTYANCNHNDLFYFTCCKYPFISQIQVCESVFLDSVRGSYKHSKIDFTFNNVKENRLSVWRSQCFNTSWRFASCRPKAELGSFSAAKFTVWKWRQNRDEHCISLEGRRLLGILQLNCSQTLIILNTQCCSIFTSGY